MILTILFGLLGFSLVVVIHEFGHYLAARAAGVAVEAFSIGWGPRLLSFRAAGTEWRLSLFPVGGYCKMKGEDSFRKAMEQKLEEIPRESGSFYAASPLRRMFISISGPLANAVFAVVAFSVVAAVGVTIHTAPNRIILASGHAAASGASSAAGAGSLQPAEPNPADVAGLRTGDRIVSIDGREMRDYMDLQEAIGTSPGKTLLLEVDRDGTSMQMRVTPRLDRSSGTGLIGIYSWSDPVVAAVEPGSAAALAGLEPGDRVLEAGGKPVANTLDFFSTLEARPERLTVEVERSGSVQSLLMVLAWSGNGAAAGSGADVTGIGFAMVERTIRSGSIPAAIALGARDTWKTAALTVKSIGLLFSGVDVLKAVSGPARITWMVGTTASEGLKSDGPAGLVNLLNFLAFLSVGLFMMNLLPVPVLDGGQILLFVVEAFRRRPLRTRTIYRFQFVGVAMVMGLFLLATLSDVLFFAAR